MNVVNSDVAYGYIREKILAGHFPPGTDLITEVLAREIGVSRTPVRDALRKLESDGLVIIQPRLGARVKQMDLGEFKEICDFRLALESHAAGLAASNRNEADLAELRLALRAMREIRDRIAAATMEGSLMEGFVREDVRFHVAVINASRNNLLKREILRLHLINRVISGPVGIDGVGVEDPGKTARDKHREEVIRDHEEILEAIARGNAREAKQVMERHLQVIVDDRIFRLVSAQRDLDTRSLSSDELAYRL